MPLDQPLEQVTEIDIAEGAPLGARVGEEAVDILIVDDEPEVLAVLKRQMQRRGYSVRTASDAFTASAALEACYPRMILLDLMMPKIDGAGFLKNLRMTHSPGSLPVIVVTASNQRADMLRCLDAGANDFVMKPVDLDALVARVDLQIAIADRSRELEARSAGGTETAERCESVNRPAAFEAMDEPVVLDAPAPSETADTVGAPGMPPGAGAFTARLASLRDAEGAASVIMFDAAAFEEVTLAHEISQGEDALRIYLWSIRSAAEGVGALYRLGSTDFAVIAEPGAAAGEFRALARDIAAGERFGVQVGRSSVHRMSSSVGLVLASSEAPDEIRIRAKIAMRAAAEAGAGRMCEYSDELRAARARQARTETRLAGALERGVVKTVFAPLVDVATGRWVGVETLPDWRDDDLGVVRPDEIAAAADMTGLALTFLEDAARSAFRAVRAVNAHAERPLFVALKAPDGCAGDPAVAPLLRRIAEEEGIGLSRVVVGFREDAVIGDLGACAQVFRALNTLGAKVAIDDFGSNYSSLAYLCRVPAQILKFDKAMLEAAGERPDARSLLGATARIAKHHGKTVMLAGVGCVDEQVIAREVGADMVQGSAVSKPLTLPELEASVHALS